MAVMKGDLGGGLDKPNFLSSLLNKPPRGIDGKPLSLSPDPFAGAEAMRDAQRKALSNYMAKVTSKPTPSMGMDEEKRRGYQNRADAPGMLGGPNAAAPQGPLGTGDLSELFGSAMSEDEIRAQAAELFAPQFDYLSGLEDAAKNRHKASDSAVAQIYAALQQSYRDDAAPVGDIYDDAAVGIEGAFDEGVQNIAKAQDETAARTAAVMKKLGIEQAGASLFKENVADAQAAQQRLRSQQAVDLSGNAGSKAAALEDLTVKRQAAGLQGADARTGLQMQLADILAGYGMKRADLNTKQAEAAMDIRSNEAKNQQDSLEWLMKQEQQRFENEDVIADNRRADNELSIKQNDALLRQESDAADMKNLSPMEQFYAAAAQAYQGNTTAASNGTKAVTDAAALFQRAKGRPPASAQDLINYIRERNMGAGDMRTLIDLATRYWDATN